MIRLFVRVFVNLFVSTGFNPGVEKESGVTRVRTRVELYTRGRILRSERGYGKNHIIPCSAGES